MEATDTKRRRKNPKTPAKKIEEGLGVDIISHLPDHLLHYIISLLPAKFAARTSVLSKRWGHLWKTFPIIELDELNYKDMGVPTCREVFLESMRLTLSNHALSHLQKLRICTLLNNDKNLDILVDELVALAVTGKAQVLDLNFATISFINVQESCYVLPEIIFSHGSSLVGLMMEGCRFKDYDAINLRSLKTFSMDNIHISEKMLQKLIYGCPFIDSLTLRLCRGFKILRVVNSKLRLLIVERCRVVGFEIDAPNLHSFTFKGGFNLDITDVKISNSCPFGFLGSLNLSSARFKAEPVRCMLSRFKNLKNISLRNCTFERTPLLQSKELTSLEIVNCYFPEQLHIATPNLQTFQLGCTKNDVKPSARLGFRDLKTFILRGHIHVQEEVLRFMITYMTSLEFLEIKSCTGFKHVRIHSSSLKCLILEKCPDVEYGELEAAKLEYFKYAGPILEFSNMITTQTLKVELHLWKKTNGDGTSIDSQLRKLSDLLLKLGEVRDITLVSKFAKFTTIPKDISVSPPLRRARNLKVKTKLRKMGYIELLSGVLHICTCHESLCIELESSSLMLKFQNFPQREYLSRKSQCNNHDCLQEHLIEVRMEKFEGNEKEMELVEFLLRKATLLRSIFIIFKRKCSRILRGQIITRINENSRASPTSEILFS